MLLELRANLLSTGLRVRRFKHVSRHVVNAWLASAFFAATAVGVLAGCVSAHRADDGPLAVPLSFGNERSKPMSVHLYGGSDDCTTRQPLVPFVQSRETRRTAVMSGQEVTFTVGQDHSLEPSSSGLVQKGCLATLTFRPEQGKSYLFRLFSAHDTCPYQLSESLRDGSGGRLTPFLTRTWIRGVTESGPFCKLRGPLL